MMENSILLNEIRLLMRAFEKFIVKIDENFSVFESNFLYDLFDEKKRVEIPQMEKTEIGRSDFYRLGQL